MDSNLTFLANCRNIDLQLLCDYLTKDKDGDTRWTEELTITEEYKKYYPNEMQKMYKVLWEELQKFGGNTFVNIFRGGGPSYREILTDVCEKMDVNFNSSSSVDVIELNLLQKIMIDSLDKMDAESLMELLKGTKNPNVTGGKQAMVAALMVAIKTGGFASYTIAVTVANAVAKFVLGRGLSIAGNAGLTRTISIFAGPIGWILTVVWTAIDIAGPAYRVTIPACVQVAYMRIASQQLLDAPAEARYIL